MPSFDAVARPKHIGQPNAAVQGHPAHQLRMQEMTRLASYLPDTLIFLTPSIGRCINYIAQKLAGRVIDAPELRLQKVRGPDQLTVDVELPLVPGGIADANRPAVAPSCKVRDFALGQVVLPTDPEHDLQIRAATDLRQRRARKEFEEPGRLVGTCCDP